MQPNYPPAHPRPQQTRASLWVWLTTAVLALACFVLVEVIVSAHWETALLMWAPFLLGIALLGAAGIAALIGAIGLASRPAARPAIFALGCLVVSVGSIWRLGKAAGALWGGAKELGTAGGALLMMNPWGMMAVGMLVSLDAAIKDAMENSTTPEWRLIDVDHAGTAHRITFEFTNTGQLDIDRMEGTLHVWDEAHYASAELPIQPDRPLKAGQSLRMSLPLDDSGQEFQEIIAGGPDVRYRYQLRRLTAGGRPFEVRGGNIEPPKEGPGFGFKRGLTNDEWATVKAEYLGADTEHFPGRAAFRLEVPAFYEATRLKGKLQVIDYERDSIEKPVDMQLDPESADPVIVALDAGRESDRAREIITSRSEFDRAVGNPEQTTYIVRFQLQELKSANGKDYRIDLLGQLKER